VVMDTGTSMEPTTQAQDAQEPLFPIACNDPCHTPHYAT